MNLKILKNSFLNLLPPPLPSDWEAEENLEQLVGLPEQRQNLIIQQVPAIWPVSNSLCYSYLACADTALSCLSEEQVNGWVATILDIYEKRGLKAAQHFMADVENNYLCRLRGETGVAIAEVAPRLSSYAKGIAGRPLILAEEARLYTDTSRLFLPAKVTVFSSKAENFLLYKLMVTAQLGLIQNRTYEMVITGDSSLAQLLFKEYDRMAVAGPLMMEDYWNIFPDPRLAEDLFTLAEGWRLGKHLAKVFPGLWRDTVKLREKLAEHRPPPASLAATSRPVEALASYLLTGRIKEANDSEAHLRQSLITRLNEPATSPEDSAIKTAALYKLLGNSRKEYVPVIPLPYLGRLQPAAVREVRLQKRGETRQKFITALAAILPDSTAKTDDNQNEEREAAEAATRLTGDDVTAMIIKPAGQDEPPDASPSTGQDEAGKLLILANPELEIPAALRDLAAEINHDLGLIPDDYISAAQGLAGRGNPPRDADAAPEGSGLSGGITYDEWDYRRVGFRKDWCTVNEKIIYPVKGTFVQSTLDKYRGILLKLRKQFEMLRCTERLVKRQRDGDDIDVDALIESISDVRAGRPGSEQLFVRLRRDDRDIAVLFLIDMSSSTEGWVGEALKESLILMGESLVVLGDRFAIAGFSGMRRTRSDFYHIKDFDEVYGEEIKGRIAAITPREYTRMGPPVRHAIGMLQEVEAKVRLLIILTDGKPEDYDDYKGDYAIEDTRHALLEARAAGIHPFCINIDQRAHDYNARMYGEVNYIFLDKVSDLPIRMPAIYRNLTT